MQTDPQPTGYHTAKSGQAGSPQICTLGAEGIRRAVSLKPLVHKAVTCHADTGRALLVAHINMAKAKGIDTFYWERHPDTTVQFYLNCATSLKAEEQNPPGRI